MTRGRDTSRQPAQETQLEQREGCSSQSQHTCPPLPALPKAVKTVCFLAQPCSEYTQTLGWSSQLRRVGWVKL